jgi:hypothetical protein
VQDAEQHRVEVDLSARIVVYDVLVALSEPRDRDQVPRSSARDVQTDVPVGDVRQ